MIRLLFSLLLLILGCSDARAQVIAVKDQGPHTQINGMCLWLEHEGTDTLKMKDVFAHPKRYPFRQGTQFQEFFNRDGWPVFATTTVQGSAGTTCFILVDNANIDSITLWYRNQDSTTRLITGSYMPPVAGINTTTKFIFPIKLDGNRQKVLMRFKNKKRLIAPLQLVKPGHLYAYLLAANGPELIMLGMVLMLLLYHGIRLIWIRRKEHMYYMLYLFCLIVYAFLYLRGFGHYLGMPLQGFVNRFGGMFGALAYLFALSFAWNYLDRSKAPKWFLEVFRTSFLLPGITILTDLFALTQLNHSLLLLLGLVIPVVMLTFAILVYRKGDMATIFFFTGWSFVGISVLSNTLLVLKVIDPAFRSIPLLLLACTCIEMVLLAGGMGYRNYLLRLEKLRLQTELVAVLKNQKAELECQVADRTQALANALVQVEESDALKSRLLAIISHDLRMPFVSLNASLDLLTLNILTPEKAQQKLANVRSNIRHIAGTLENLLTWSKHQQQRIQTHLEPIDLRAIAESVCSLLETNISSKNLVSQLEIEGNPQVLADRFQLEAILRNLLSNGIKASNAQSVVGLRCAPEAGGAMYRIVVFDSGLGLQEENLAAWLKRNNPLQDGTTLLSGLGLQICREFLANHQSELCYSHNGEGSEFSFLLPAAPQIND